MTSMSGKRRTAQCTSDQQCAGAGHPPRALDDALARLTRRQRDILPLLAAGHTNRQIATTLNLTERTAEWHISNILSRLQMSRREIIAAYAPHVQPPNPKVSGQSS